jgi:hypothetical protein
MSIINLRTLLQKSGSTSPIALGALYTLSVVVLTAIDALMGENPAVSAIVVFLSIGVLCLLFATVTWFRDDDWLAAGVLITLSLYAAMAAQGFLLVLLRGGIGPAALWSAVTVGGAIIYAILMAPVVGGLVVLARRLTREWRVPLHSARRS